MIRLDDVRFSIGGQEVLKGVGLHVARGDTKVVLGASGSGKSVLLKLILGLYRPDRGTITIADQNIARMTQEELYGVRQKIAMVFQGGALFDSLTVRENVGYRLNEQGILSEEDIERRVFESLSFVDLADTLDKMPGELSGGMRKRLAIARAIAADPEVILFDEPTSGLDPINAFNINRLILRLRRKEGVTSVVVTHDLASAFVVADRIAMLHDGKIIFDGTAEELRRSQDERVHMFLQPAVFERDADKKKGATP